MRQNQDGTGRQSRHLRALHALSILAAMSSCAPEVIIPDNGGQTDSPYKTTNSYVVNGKWIGEGEEIDGTVWAPVNCGYDAKNYPGGRLYHWGRPDANYYGFAEKSETAWKKVVDDEFLHAENDPCPTGWRVPSSKELEKLFLGKVSALTVDAKTGLQGRVFSGIEGRRSVFLPAAGFYEAKSESEVGKGTEGRYWSCDQADENTAKTLYFTGDPPPDTNEVGQGLEPKDDACSIRCVKI